MTEIQKIIKDIEKSGFMTEPRVGQELGSKNWKVSFGETYLDYDEKKAGKSTFRHINSKTIKM